MTIKLLEPEAKLIPIRQRYFSKAFWEQWEKLSVWQREVYIMGWLAKLDHMLTQIDGRMKGGDVKDEGNCD